MYHLDTTIYSELAVSSSAVGLAKIVTRALIGTGKFPTDGTTAVVAGQLGTRSEAHARAMRSMQRSDFGARGLYHLLRVRDLILPYTDAQTTTALDEAIASYVRVQLLRPDVQLAEQWPGAEWFLESDGEVPEFPPPTRGPIEAAISNAMSRHLRIERGRLIVNIFNEHGRLNWSRSLEGTFVVARRVLNAG